MMEKIWLKSYQMGVPSTIEDQMEKYQCIPDILEESFKSFKENKAFHCMGKELTFSDIDQLSLKFASYLQNNLNLKMGDRVALMLPNILQYPIALFGILRAGMVVVNVNPLYTPRELEHQLKDSGAKAIVIFENACFTLQSVLPHTEVEHVITTAIGDLLGFPKHLIVNFVIKNIKKMVPDWTIANTINFVDVLNKSDIDKFQKPLLKKDSIAFLQYTGGTTGVAKGAVLLHKNIIANICQARAWLYPSIVKGEEIVISPLPLYHIFSLTVTCIFVTVGGLNVLITNPRDMRGFIKELKNWKFTVITGVNTLFNGLLNNANFKDVDFSAVKICLGGGAAVQKVVAEKWKKITGKTLIEAYGLTETSPAASMNPLNLKEYNGFIGLPIPSTEILIKDDNEKTLDIGEPGEICIKGPQVMQGYWNRDDETAKVMSKDGFLKTGDVGIMNAEGYFKIVDRKKEMILVSGFNVYPSEIEEIVSQNNKVLEVAAIGVPDEKTGEAIKIFIVKKDESLTKEEIIKHCRESLTSYKIPHQVEFRKELPKSNIGKILRKDLKN